MRKTMYYSLGTMEECSVERKEQRGEAQKGENGGGDLRNC